ncbi:MAG: hypothetical protein J6B98_04410 [Bacilli bacterium]|nr:hypothetical protein [Bacilli bacterium]
MILNDIEEFLKKNKKVEIKLFSLEYIILLENDNYIIYPKLYSARRNIYKSYEELINNYTVYNESLVDNANRIIIVE